MHDLRIFTIIAVLLTGCSPNPEKAEQHDKTPFSNYSPSFQADYHNPVDWDKPRNYPAIKYKIAADDRRCKELRIYQNDANSTNDEALVEWTKYVIRNGCRKWLDSKASPTRTDFFHPVDWAAHFNHLEDEYKKAAYEANCTDLQMFFDLTHDSAGGWRRKGVSIYELGQWLDHAMYQAGCYKDNYSPHKNEYKEIFTAE